MDAAAEAKEILRRPHFALVYREMQAALAEEKARRERFYAEIDEDSHAEFVDGEVVMHSPVRSKHNVAVRHLSTVINFHVSRHDLGYVGIDSLMICLTRNDFEPDVCFFCKEKAAAFTPDQLKFPAPDFIAEVLSPSTERCDRGIKFIDYAAHGVGEYWIVDADAEIIEQYLLSGAEYRLAGKRAGAENIASEVIAGLRFPVNVLFNEQAAQAYYRQ